MVAKVWFTREAYGPIMLICCWAKGCKAPLYLVTNMDAAEEACRLYSKRFRRETFFSDQKSRGFHLHKSHLSNPQRLSRLLIAACLAYIWIVYLGSVCMKEGWVRIGCLNWLLSIDRFLDSRCQSRLCSAWWRRIFKQSASNRVPHVRPQTFFVTI